MLNLSRPIGKLSRQADSRHHSPAPGFCFLCTGCAVELSFPCTGHYCCPISYLWCCDSDWSADRNSPSPPSPISAASPSSASRRLRQPGPVLDPGKLCFEELEELLGKRAEAMREKDSRCDFMGCPAREENEKLTAQSQLIQQEQDQVSLMTYSEIFRSSFLGCNCRGGSM